MVHPARLLEIYLLGSARNKFLRASVTSEPTACIFAAANLRRGFGAHGRRQIKKISPRTNLFYLGRTMGLEPTASGSTDQRSNQTELRSPYLYRHAKSHRTGMIVTDVVNVF